MWKSFVNQIIRWHINGESRSRLYRQSDRKAIDHCDRQLLLFFCSSSPWGNVLSPSHGTLLCPCPHRSWEHRGRPSLPQRLPPGNWDLQTRRYWRLLEGQQCARGPLAPVQGILTALVPAPPSCMVSLPFQSVSSSGVFSANSFLLLKLVTACVSCN